MYSNTPSCSDRTKVELWPRVAQRLDNASLVASVQQLLQHVLHSLAALPPFHYQCCICDRFQHAPKVPLQRSPSAQPRRRPPEPSSSASQNTLKSTPHRSSAPLLGCMQVGIVPRIEQGGQKSQTPSFVPHLHISGTQTAVHKKSELVIWVIVSLLSAKAISSMNIIYCVSRHLHLILVLFLRAMPRGILHFVGNNARSPCCIPFMPLRPAHLSSFIITAVVVLFVISNSRTYHIFQPPS